MSRQRACSLTLNCDVIRLSSLYSFTQIDQYDVDTEKAVDRISRQLLEHNIVTEGYGGEVPIVPVSAAALPCSPSCASSDCGMSISGTVIRSGRSSQ